LPRRSTPWLGAARPVENVDIDLTQWTHPDIATVADDPFGKLVKYGYAPA
jgi:thiosulfate dehydrogenase